MSHVKTKLEERIEIIQGHLLMANFKADKQGCYQCRIYSDDGSYIRCTFEDKLIDTVEKAIRCYVSAIGIAKVEPITRQIISLRIRAIIVKEGDEAEFLQKSENTLQEYRSENDTAENFRQAFREFLQGETFPISTLWDNLDDE